MSPAFPARRRTARAPREHSNWDRRRTDPERPLPFHRISRVRRAALAQEEPHFPGRSPVPRRSQEYPGHLAEEDLRAVPAEVELFRRPSPFSVAMRSDSGKAGRTRRKGGEVRSSPGALHSSTVSPSTPPALPRSRPDPSGASPRRSHERSYPYSFAMVSRNPRRSASTRSPPVRAANHAWARRFAGSSRRISPMIRSRWNVLPGTVQSARVTSGRWTRRGFPSEPVPVPPGGTLLLVRFGSTAAAFLRTADPLPRGPLGGSSSAGRISYTSPPS